MSQRWPPPELLDERGCLPPSSFAAAWALARDRGAELESGPRSVVHLKIEAPALDDLRKRLNKQVEDATASLAAGPWVPGEPPEECKASEESLLVQVLDGGPTLVRFVHWVEGDCGEGIWDDGRCGWWGRQILYYARIFNMPKAE